MPFIKIIENRLIPNNLINREISMNNQKRSPFNFVKFCIYICFCFVYDLLSLSEKVSLNDVVAFAVAKF